MNKPKETWYVRTPDGRVVRANSTESVRHHIRLGSFASNSEARREPNSTWMPFRQLDAFADLIPPEPEAASGVSSRLDPLKLHTVGVRGVVEELIAAMDSTLVRAKLRTGCVVGVIVFLAGILVLRLTDMIGVPADWQWIGRPVALLIQGLLLAPAVAILTRLTHTEVAMMRRAEWSEGTQALAPITFRLILAYLLIPGVAFLLLVLLRQVTEWTLLGCQNANLSPGITEIAVSAVWAIALLLRVMMWVIIGLTGVLAPILVVEDCTVGEAVANWLALIRRSLGRLVVYEAMAIALGLVITLPLGLPVYLSIGTSPMPFDNLVSELMLAGLLGLAAGVFLAYFAVANVFIYLNLQYEN